MNNEITVSTTATLISNVGGEPRISSTTVALHTDTEHQHIVRLIRANESDLLELGDFPAVETEKSTGGRPAQHYLLNEPQAALIMSILRSSEVVRAFRLKMIKAFVAMAQQLRQPQFPQTYVTALEAFTSEVKRNIELTAAIQLKEAQLEEVKPKALHFDRTMALGDSLSINEGAKLLGYQPVAFRKFLRFGGWIYKSNKREIPKEDRITDGHMLLKMSDFGGSARITQSGVPAIERHIQRLLTKYPDKYRVIFG
jgi:phage antirepressor YoqD-like protein